MCLILKIQFLITFFSDDQVLINPHFRHIKETGGIPKLVALTRVEDEGNKDDENRLRSYSEKVITEANRVRTLRWSTCFQCYSLIKLQVYYKQREKWRYLTYLNSVINWCVHKRQKQPPELFHKENCSEKFRNIHRKTPVLKYLFNNVAGLQVSNFIKKWIELIRFSVDIAKFLRTHLFWRASGNSCLWIGNIKRGHSHFFMNRILEEEWCNTACKEKWNTLIIELYVTSLTL